MTIFDTHCHYNLEPLSHEWESKWVEAQKNGVEKTLIIGIDEQSSQDAQQLAADNNNLYASIGFHPHECQVINPETSSINLKQTLENLVRQPKVIAIGETGLDYFRLSPGDSEQKHNQVSAFCSHIEVANEHQLPLILHVRDQATDAYNDTLTTLKKYKNSSTPFILHCVSGPDEYVQEAVAMGAYVSVAGNVTYKNADNIRKLVNLVPTDRLLIETDAPFLPPHQFRGKTCEPWMISMTAKFVQNELHRDLEQMYENSLRVFNLN